MSVESDHCPGAGVEKVEQLTGMRVELSYEAPEMSRVITVVVIDTDWVVSVE